MNSLSVTTFDSISGFRFNAAIDWIEVRITLSSPSQPQHVRSRMPQHWGLPYVQAETMESSRTSQIFTFRVQDPLGPHQFMQELAELARPGESALTVADVVITGIEIAFDAYHESSTFEKLIDMTEKLFWRQSMLPNAALLPRLCPPKDSGQGVDYAIVADTVRRRLEQGWTINAGDQGADYSRRWYLKRHDTRNGESYAPLPMDRWCARSEVTLRGNRLPFSTVDGWCAFRFETLLSQHFNWRMATDERFVQQQPEAWQNLVGRSLGVKFGVKRKDRRKTRSGTKVDVKLRQQAKNALERLTRHQRGRADFNQAGAATLCP